MTSEVVRRFRKNHAPKNRASQIAIADMSDGSADVREVERLAARVEQLETAADRSDVRITVNHGR